MASPSDVIALVSSLALRLSVYIFLRWVSSPPPVTRLDSTPVQCIVCARKLTIDYHRFRHLLVCTPAEPRSYSNHRNHRSCRPSLPP